MTKAKGDMWDRLFKRIDSFTTRLEPTETDARDAVNVASYALELAFVGGIIEHPSDARKVKDVIVEQLRQYGVSPKRIEAISKDLVELCEIVEKTE